MAQDLLQHVFRVEAGDQEIERAEDVVIEFVMKALRANYHPEDTALAIVFVPASVVGLEPTGLETASARADSSSMACGLIILRNDNIVRGAADRALEYLKRVTRGES